MTKSHWSEILRQLNACNEAVKWAKQYPTVRAAWFACKRPDWIRWVLEMLAGLDACWEAERRLRPFAPLYQYSNNCQTPLPFSAPSLDTERETFAEWCDVLRTTMPVPTLADLRATACGEKPWVKA